MDKETALAIQLALLAGKECSCGYPVSSYHVNAWGFSFHRPSCAWRLRQEKERELMVLTQSVLDDSVNTEEQSVR